MIPFWHVIISLLVGIGLLAFFWGSNMPKKWCLFFCFVSFFVCLNFYRLSIIEGEYNSQQSLTLDSQVNEFVSEAISSKRISENHEIDPLPTQTNPFLAALASANRPNVDSLAEFAMNVKDVNEKIMLPPDLIAVMNRYVTATGLDSTYMVKKGDWTTALAICVQLNAENAVNTLLDRGADPNAKICATLSRPLRQAILNQSCHTVSNLLAHGADPNHIGLDGNSVSTAVKSWTSRQQAFRKLYHSGDLFSDGKMNEKIIHNVVRDGLLNETDIDTTVSLEILRLVIEFGGDIYSKNEQGVEPLASAFLANNLPAFRFLLSVHKNPQSCIVPTNGGSIPIAYAAAMYGRTKIPFLEAMKDAGFDFSQRYNGFSITSVTDDPELKEWFEQISKRGFQGE